MMTEAAKEARRAYKREWSKNHRENIQAAQERYWLKKADEIRQKQSAAE